MEKKQPSFRGSIAIVSLVIFVLGVSILHYGVAPQIPIVIAAIIVGFYGLLKGHSWKDLEKAMTDGIVSGLPSILILSLIGVLIGVWTLNGTVPTLTFYFLHILSPTFFLVSALVITAVTATVTGSSWSAMGTIGVALMSTAYGLDAPMAMTAGAIVSGALFGDKLSPLSDTTNLASAVANADIFDHIKHMLWTTIPSFIITAVIFLFLGFNFVSGNNISSDFATFTNSLQTEFAITPWTLLSPLLILILAVKRVKPIPSLILGFIVAVITTFFTAPGASMGTIMNVAHNGYKADTGVKAIDSLMSIGGLSSMMSGVSLIIVALAFGGIIQKTGIVGSIIDGLGTILTKKGHVISITVGASLGVNVLVGEQYLSIVLPGKFLGKAYENLKLHPKNLSRTLEDGGTLTHALIPWGVLGVFAMSTLGVGMEYVFFTFLCMINPIIAIIYGYFGISQPPIDQSEPESLDVDDRDDMTVS